MSSPNPLSSRAEHEICPLAKAPHFNNGVSAEVNGLPKATAYVASTQLPFSYSVLHIACLADATPQVAYVGRIDLELALFVCLFVFNSVPGMVLSILPVLNAGLLDDPKGGCVPCVDKETEIQSFSSSHTAG